LCSHSGHIKLAGDVYPEGGNLDFDLVHPVMASRNHRQRKSDSRMGRLGDYISEQTDLAITSLNNRKQRSRKHHTHSSLLETGSGAEAGAETEFLTMDDAFLPLQMEQVNAPEEDEFVFTYHNGNDDVMPEYHRDVVHEPISLKRDQFEESPQDSTTPDVFRQLFSHDDTDSRDDMVVSALRKTGSHAPRPQNVLRKALKIAHERGLKEGRAAAREEFQRKIRKERAIFMDQSFSEDEDQPSIRSFSLKRLSSEAEPEDKVRAKVHEVIRLK
jgi:hypothetical protein